jgi:hypothetical protein
MLVAYDRDGKIIDILKRKSRVALEPAVCAELQMKGLPFYLEIDVPPGDIYLRTGVYDLKLQQRRHARNSVERSCQLNTSCEVRAVCKLAHLKWLS